MWSNEISIDKRYGREIEYILGKLQTMKDLSFATEESKDRVWIYLASVCERQDAIEEELENIMETVVLTFLKMRFFVERLNIGKMSYAECVLVCSLVHFDKDFERTIIRKVFSNALDYNLDGIFNFRLKALKDEWQELSDVSSRLLASASTDADVFEVVSFIAGGENGGNVLVVGDVAKNLTQHKNIEVPCVFDEWEYNLLCALIEEKPMEIVIETRNLSREAISSLKRISRVIEKQ